MPYGGVATAAFNTKIAAFNLGGARVDITHFAVGDSNGVEYTPTGAESALVHQVWQGTVNSVYPHPNHANWLVVEARIPADVGGWTVREIAIKDNTGAMMAIANYPPTPKVAPGLGVDGDLYVRVIIQITNTAAVTQVIDGSLVMATCEYVDRRVPRNVKAAATANVTLSGLQTIDGVSLIAGDRVLLTSQATNSANGIYAVAAGAWARTTDADSSLEVLPSMLVVVEQGTVNSDSVWILATDAPITLGTTGLTFSKIYPDERNRTISDTTAPTGDAGTPTTLLGWLANMIKSITGKSNWRTAPATTLEAAKAHIDAATPHSGHAPLNNAALTGIPTAPTAQVGTNTTQLATTAFTRAEIAALIASSPASLDTLNELATALGNDPNFATTMTNNLAGKIGHSLATAANDFLVASGAGAFVKKTLVEVKALLGLGTILDAPFIVVQHQEASGTNVASLAADPNGWQTRSLQEVVDSANIATVSSNQITLPAGTYHVRGYANGYAVNMHRCRLKNVTDNTVIALGSTEYARGSYDGASRSTIETRFTIAGPKTFALEHWTTVGYYYGLGHPCSTGDNEIYAEVVFCKVA